jgi:hypothetical protein
MASANTLSEDELYKLEVAVCVSATLSLLGSSVIIFTFLAFRDVRKELGAQLIFFLNLSDFLMSLSWFPWWGYIPTYFPSLPFLLTILQARQK